jgi:hypothetical protein
MVTQQILVLFFRVRVLVTQQAKASPIRGGFFYGYKNIPDMNEQQTPPPQQTDNQDFKHLDWLAKWMDNQFALPGTNFRFGFDAVLGLIPGAGDILGLLVSGVLLRIMLRKGAGPILMLCMLGNVLLDALVGVVPLAGDIFDFGFKANRRNVDLLKRYYAENPNRPSAKRSLALISLLFFVLFLVLLYGIWKGIALLWAFMTGLF